MDGGVILDPVVQEEKLSSAGITIAYMPSLNEVTQLFQWGEVEYSKIQEVCIPYIYIYISFSRNHSILPLVSLISIYYYILSSRESI